MLEGDGGCSQKEAVERTQERMCNAGNPQSERSVRTPAKAIADSRLRVDLSDLGSNT